MTTSATRAHLISQLAAAKDTEEVNLIELKLRVLESQNSSEEAAT